MDKKWCPVLLKKPQDIFFYDLYSNNFRHLYSFSLQRLRTSRFQVYSLALWWCPSLYILWGSRIVYTGLKLVEHFFIFGFLFFLQIRLYTKDNIINYYEKKNGWTSFIRNCIRFNPGDYLWIIRYSVFTISPRGST